jgi:hypothetical protein
VAVRKNTLTGLLQGTARILRKLTGSLSASPSYVFKQRIFFHKRNFSSVSRVYKFPGSVGRIPRTFVRLRYE